MTPLPPALAPLAKHQLSTLCVVACDMLALKSGRLMVSLSLLPLTQEDCKQQEMPNDQAYTPSADAVCHTCHSL